MVNKKSIDNYVHLDIPREKRLKGIKAFLNIRLNKQIINIGIVILLLCIGLSGCQTITENNGQIDNEHSESIAIVFFAAVVRNDSYAGSVVCYAIARSRIGKNLTYEVDTGEDVNYNGTIIRVIGHGTKSTHTYYKWNTNYTVKLIVHDEEGNVNTTIQIVHIGTPPANQLYIERNTNLPDMNDLTYAEVYKLYKITAI